MTDKPKTRTLAEMTQFVAAGEEKTKGIPRFISSGISGDAYKGTRIRRYQRNQSFAVMAGLQKFEVFTPEQLRIRIRESNILHFKATSFLQSCLVGPEKPTGAAQLFRKGDAGTAKMMQELKPSQIAEALIRACQHVGVLTEDSAPVIPAGEGVEPDGLDDDVSDSGVDDDASNPKST